MDHLLSNGSAHPIIENHKDPVCGMDVDPATAKHHTSLQSDHQCQDYYFCSADCQVKFETEPSKCLDESAPP